MIIVELNEQEYQAIYQVIKEAAIITCSTGEYSKILNVVLLKIIKAAHPEFCKHIGPW